MGKVAAIVIILLGLALSVGLLFAEHKYSSKLFNQSMKSQVKINKAPKHVLYFIFKTFEWGLLVMTWGILMLTLYFNFNKFVSWKILSFCWTLSVTVELLRLLMRGCRPIFMSKSLSLSGCECTFGIASWYVSFVLLFWLMFYNDVLGKIDVIDVSFFFFFFQSKNKF